MESSLFISGKLLSITTFVYFFAMLFYIIYVVSRSNMVGLLGTAATALGFLIGTGGLILRWIESYQMGIGRAPLTNLYESLIFFAWCTAVIYLAFEFYYKNRFMGAFVLPFVSVSMAFASFSPIVSQEIQPLVPALQSNWLIYHVVTCFFAYAAFAVACGVSVMYVIKNKKEEKKLPAGNILSLFPSTPTLDDINYKAIAVGFPMLSLGIITGAAWANYAWGSYWSWDPKETWSLITWFVYAAFLHARFTRGWRGKKAAWLSIIGFFSVIVTYLGVNLLLSGLHSYGS
jgi:cytochrome c-type biogenesis protein CcsB